MRSQRAERGKCFTSFIYYEGKNSQSMVRRAGAISTLSGQTPHFVDQLSILFPVIY